MKRSPPDSITQKVRRIFGRGMLEGVRAAGIPNPEEFLMNQKRMRSVVAGLNGVATKVLSAVPLVEDWTLNQIAAELHRQDKGYTLDVVEGSLAKLLEVGTEVQKAQLETAAQLGFALAIRHWSTSTYHVHAIKPEEL